MKMPPSRPKSIRDHLSSAGKTFRNSERFLRGGASSLSLTDIVNGTCLSEKTEELAGRTILLVTHDQLAAAIAMIELDGVAGRMVVCPPDVSVRHLPSVIAKACVDTVASDTELRDRTVFKGLKRVRCSVAPSPTQRAAKIEPRRTEWVLLTSGTSGAPKMIAHTFASLTAPIAIDQESMTSPEVVWGTFYDMRRYGGLQIFLRAILGNGSMLLSDADEPVADHLIRLREHGVTHLSGTPSHWRRALMSGQAQTIRPRYVRLSGEMVDQGILNALRTCYPESAIGHAFASTEAGVAFEVNDGLAGFPADLLRNEGAVEMRIVDNSLQIRSSRAASRYLDDNHGELADRDGFVDTGDVVELRGDRYYFLGRRNGVINVGGMKVFPEEIEAVIHRHSAVRMCAVRSRPNPFMGALVSADVVLNDTAAPEGARKDEAGVREEILALCREALPAHKIPATIRFVPALEVGAAGKLVRDRSQHLSQQSNQEREAQNAAQPA